MDIVLKEDWDIPVQVPGRENIGHFIGRDSEVDFLTNELSRRNQGSILISGHRGVGKTSLVYKALRNISDKKILFVLMNATHLEPDEPEKDLPYAKQVIINLIRRLYSACKSARESNIISDEVFKRVKELYHKAVAEEYKSSVQYLTTEAERLESVKTIETAIFSDNVNIGIWISSFILAVIIAYIPISNPIFSVIQKVISLILTVPFPLGISIFRNSKKIKGFVSQNTSTAEQLYTLDNNVGNLAFDLEEIHIMLAKEKRKVIYVIDELDKLGVSSQSSNNTLYLTIFKHFKNLFTLSSAIFIFITGEDVYQHFKNSDKKIFYRSQEYTYFSNKYFLSRPTEQDTLDFIDSIIENISDLNTGETRKKFENFKRYLSFTAQSDFFDLLQAIRNRISRFEGLKPIISIKELTSEEQLKAGLQKALSVVYCDKYFSKSPSEWENNELLIRELYEHVIFLAGLKLNATFQDENTNSNPDRAKRDLNYFCYRHELLDLTSETNMDINGEKFVVRAYKFSGEFGLTIPDMLNFQSEIERNFVQKMEELNQKLDELKSLYMKFNPNYEDNGIEDFVRVLESWGVNLRTWATLNQKYKKLLENNPPYPYNRDEIEAASENADKTKKDLTNFNVEIISNMIKDLSSINGFQLDKLSNNSNLFSGSLMAFRNEVIKQKHFVVFDNEYRREVLILSNIVNEIIDKHKNILSENSKNHLVILTDPEDVKSNWKRGIVTMSISNRKDILNKLNKLNSWLSINMENDIDSIKT
jgi:hypothetical protein